MATLNEAWRVLGDPTRRRQYDQAQAEPVRVDAADTVAFAPEARVPRERPRSGCRHARRERCPVARDAVRALAHLRDHHVRARSARDEPETRGSDGIVEIGSCLALVTGQPVIEVSCTEPHDGRAAAIIPLDLACPMETEYYVAPGGSARVCVDTEERP